MKQDIYHFDKKHVTYVKRKKDWRYYLERGLIFGGLVLVFAFGFVFLFYKIYDSPESATLNRHQTLLKEAITDYDNYLAQYGNDVKALKLTEKNLYRKILNAEPVEDEELQTVSGKKGGEEDAHISQSEVNKLEKKLKDLDAKLSNSGTTALITEMSKKKPAELRQMPLIMPVAADIISGYGNRQQPIHKTDKMHYGIDIKADMGTKVLATGDGVVVETGTKANGMGLFVTIRHNNEYTTKYAHLSKANVNVGQWVKRGEVIGLSGSSGLSKGPHLHYEIWKKGEPVDPINYFVIDVKPEVFVKLLEQAKQFNESMD